MIFVWVEIPAKMIQETLDNLPNSGIPSDIRGINKIFIIFLILKEWSLFYKLIYRFESTKLMDRG